MNEETALNLHVEMWNAMAENGYTRKDQTALVKKYKPAADCFLCEAYRKEAGSCEKCPFARFSLGSFTDEDDRPGCERDASPYVDFLLFKQPNKPLRETCIRIADLVL